MTVAELQQNVGAPAPGADVYHRVEAGLEAIAWEGEANGRRGWWWVVARGFEVLALGWSRGDELQRNLVLARQLVGGALAAAPGLPS